LLTFIAFALPLGLFLSHPSCFWNFDGVACASALELGDPLFLFHSNHLLYGFLGFIFWKLFAILPGGLRALPALHLFTSILSAIAFAGLFRLLLQAGVSRLTALLAVLAVSSFAVVWMWSIEAQVYALGMIGLAWGTVTLVRSESPHKYMTAGGWFALALLGHVMNGLWAIPALYWIFQETRKQPAARRDAFLQFAGTSALLTLIPYLLVFFGVVWRRYHDWGPALIWLKGSAGLTSTRAWEWHLPGITSPLIWGETTLRFFSGAFWPYGSHSVTFVEWTLTAIGMATVGYLLYRATRFASRPLVRFAWLWLASYMLFLWTWEPATECYRLTDVIPLGLLIGLGLAQIASPQKQAMIAIGLFLAFAYTNGTTRIRPMAIAENNRTYQEVAALAKLTPATTVYVTPGGSTWIYLLYFTGRSAYSLATPGGRRILAQHAGMGGPPVVVHASALRDRDVGPVLQSRRWRPLTNELPWLILE
jgi:hypothetical protein